MINQKTRPMNMRKQHILTLALLFTSAMAFAQGGDGQFVIKKGNNYLAHVNNGGTWEVQNVTPFNPNTCLWYSGTNFNPSGTNHNYYFYDGENYRFLSAPMEPDGTLSLSASLPATSLLRNTDQIYYFYDWDKDTYGGGLARGHQHNVTTASECTTCGGNWHDVNGQGTYQCWEVYWVEYDGQWKLTHESHYSRNPVEDDEHGGVPNAGLYRGVTITEHSAQVTTTDPDHPGLTGLTIPHSEMNQNGHQQLSSTISGEGFSYNYIPAYTQYVFEGVAHYFSGGENLVNPPVPTPGSSGESDATYEWTISGEGAYYLTFDDGGEHYYTSTEQSPNIYYAFENTEGRKVATVTLTVTYSNTGATQTLSANILLNVECQSPGISDESINYDEVSISWYPTADSYRVYLTTDPADWGSPLYEGDATSYTFTGLAYHTHYYYKVTGICGGAEQSATQYDFETPNEPGLLVYGAIFGGGRMADVTGNTEVVVINCENIGAIYGGNDIAGTVDGNASIILGVNTGDTYASYGTTGDDIHIGDVYGGGNGYYAYNGSSFVPASSDYTTQTVAPGASIKAMTASHEVGEVAWTNNGTENVDLLFPKIERTTINVTNDYIKIDSVFGGAKNAFLTAMSNDGSLITFDGGTAYAVYGGNNFGGGQGYGVHHIVVNGTKTDLNPEYTVYGRDFGIGYLFGGGNKVYGSTTKVEIFGGQCDIIFGGGNAADVYAANVTVNCQPGDYSGVTCGKIYSQAISGYSGGTLTVKEYDDYAWDGTGIYNVRTLFGGNNKATMAAVPTVTLTSGSVGTVYGGGNAGDMLANQSGTITYAGDNTNIGYGTHVVMNSPTVLVDYLYGGCQVSNVDYSTWVELKNGHVGTVYGGCNVSGDVGSTKINPNHTSYPSLEYQAVQGATYVVATGGTVYRSLFAGSNGFYHCNNGTVYVSGIDYGDPEGNYIGMNIPTHNETYVIVSKDDEAGTAATVKGNVYAGGNMAPVGFTFDYVAAKPSYPAVVGLSSVRMNGGTVEGDVYGGGNMASINGINEVQISGGTINGALYGGNDRLGAVAEMTNRKLPDNYKLASDGITSVENVHSYISLTGTPNINTVFGGGNGDYIYDGTGDMQYCNATDQPIQTNTFVDINISDDGYISTVYGGGDGVHVAGSCTVFLNVNSPTYNHDHVGTIFGGNNKGNLNDIVPNIILLRGQVNTVYGGCNEGSLGHHDDLTLGGTTYNNIGSYVYLRGSYDGNVHDEIDPVPATAKVSGYVYGGCKMNGVTYNSMVLVEAGDHSGVGIFGGSDISGNIGGTSRVVVTGGTVGDVYGGGNGNYIYANNNVYDLDNTLIAEGSIEAPITAPFSTASQVDMVRGNAANLYAGGYAGESGETHILVSGGTVSGNVFGGGNQAGVVIVDTNPDPDVTENTTGNSVVEMTGGSVGTGIYGGCNNTGDIEGNVMVSVTGGNIGAEEAHANIHGGGYGAPTTVAGDVSVNFGEDLDGNHNENLNLYGDLYGGSAFGSVNTNEMNTTTIYINNGTINGNVYGGGLGDAGDGTKGWTKGVVHVFVGGENNSIYFGKASFNHSSIFGCNNLNGSPQTDVYVDVYQTAHEEGVNTVNDDDYAIYRVFGGGNQADYAPENNSPSSLKVTHVHIHGCYNTIEEVYGGSNQADAISTRSVVDGGRFHYIFGGGNGLGGPANVGVDDHIHSTFSQIKGGHVAFCFGGSNSQGICINIVQSFETENLCGPLAIDNIYNGGNFADQVGEMVLNFSCETPENYEKAYGGCRLGSVYGNITVNVYGGNIGTLFGGCQGEGGQVGLEHPSNVKKYDSEHYPVGHPELIGTGGNVTVNLYGGTIGEVYGGCDLNGNVEGRISINVYHIENNCGLFIGNIYGASNHTDYAPVSLAEGISTPKVSIIKGYVGKYIKSDGTIVDGYDFNNNGTIEDNEIYAGNVFGGGNLGKVTSNPQVIVGESTNTKPVTIKGDVYGGGDNGDINGTTDVIIVPNSHELTINAPLGSGNALRVTDILGNTVTSGASIDEYSDLKLVAMPSIYGQRFTGWTIAGEGATVINSTLVSTTFIMGTADATITAGFGQATTHPLTVVNHNPSYGSVSVIDPQGHAVDLTQGISEGAELTLVAEPVTGYAFAGWSVEGEDAGVITSLLSPTTTFVMGTGEATIHASFVRTHTLVINKDPNNSSVSVLVTDTQGNIIDSGDAVREGAVLNLVATHAQGYTFTSWSYIGQGSSIGSVSSATTTFTMGTGDASVTARFTAVP